MAPRSVLVTGASRGFGLGLVKHLAALPSPPLVILAACRDPDTAHELQAVARRPDSHVTVVRMDVANDEEIRSAFEVARGVLGEEGLSVLVNNAAIYDRTDEGFLLEQTRDRMQSHFNVNVTGPVMVVKQFLPLLKKAADEKSSLPLGYGRAAVLNVSSSMGSLQHTHNTRCRGYHYRASKAALNMVTVAMAMELKPQGVLVAAVHPGRLQTAMGSLDADLHPDDSAAQCWAVLTSLTGDQAGRLFRHDGTRMDW